MNPFSSLLLATGCAIMVAICGCGQGSEPTVIQPTDRYELTEQEARNRQRANVLQSQQGQQ